MHVEGFQKVPATKGSWLTFFFCSMAVPFLVLDSFSGVWQDPDSSISPSECTELLKVGSLSFSFHLCCIGPVDVT